MLKLFHTSDIHIGARNKYIGEDLFLYQKKFLNRLYTDALSENVNFVVIAGDVFDSNYIPSFVAREFFDIVMHYKDIYTILIPGGGIRTEEGITGHDAYTEESIFKRPELKKYLETDNIILLTPDNRTTVINNIAFYAGFFEIPKIEKRDAMHHIGIIHGPFSNMPQKGELNVNELEDMFFDYICLGHYHSYTKFNKSAYSGCLVQYEFLKKRKIESGYIKVIIDDVVDIKYTVFSDAPKFYKKDIFSIDDIKWIQNFINNHTFIEITGYVKELKSDIEEILSSYSDNIFMSDAYIEYERDGMYSIIEDSIDDIIYQYEEYESEILEEVKLFILNNLNRKITKPNIEEYLNNRFLL